MLLLGELLTEALAHSGAARMHGISAAVNSRRLGVPLAQELAAAFEQATLLSRRGVPDSRWRRRLLGPLSRIS